MSIALFFITHEGIASNLLSVGETIMQQPNSNMSYLEIPVGAALDDMIKNIEQKITTLNTDDGLFFITDIYGSTPSNLAQRLANKYQAPLISGVNLPMIIRLLNYREEQEDQLLKKALEGARLGIQDHTTETKI